MLTTSLCPTCKTVIPATITVQDTVLMTKVCPEHGDFIGTVEISPEWYKICRQINNQNIYDGFMLDVTGACNLTCKYCYHDNHGQHTPLPELLEQIKQHAVLGPIILTGGEPTLHPDIIQILQGARQNGQYWMLTNGIKLADPQFFEQALPWLDCNGTLMIGLSLHQESNGADLNFLELCRQRGKKIGTVFYVIDDLKQIDHALALYDEFSDVICSLRIKAASNLGNETRANNHIYTSEMVANILARGGQLDSRYSNKISYASMLLAGKEIRLISWYNINNIDLNDIAGPPYCFAKNGSINNLVTSCILDGKATP